MIKYLIAALIGLIGGLCWRDGLKPTAIAGAIKGKELLRLGSCPAATSDISLNLTNRQKAIDKANYGPANPNDSNELYWKKMAESWNISPSEAKTMRCGNCIFFNISPSMLDCIHKGLEGNPRITLVQDVGQLGYCEAFNFKCSALRTCAAWVVGGPIT